MPLCPEGFHPSAGFLPAAAQSLSFTQQASFHLGPFLPEETSSWAMPMREKLQGHFLFCLGNLGLAFQNTGDLEGALT